MDEAVIGRSGVFGYDKTEDITDSRCPRSKSYLVYFGYEMKMPPVLKYPIGEASSCVDLGWSLFAWEAFEINFWHYRYCQLTHTGHSLDTREGQRRVLIIHLIRITMK